MDTYSRAATVLSVHGGNLPGTPSPPPGRSVVISRSGVQEATRTPWILCEWELLAGLSEFPRSAGQAGSCPSSGRSRKKWRWRRKSWWEGSKHSLCKRPPSARGGQGCIDACPKHALVWVLNPHCFLLTPPHLPLCPFYTFSCQGENYICSALQFSVDKHVIVMVYGRLFTNFLHSSPCPVEPTLVRLNLPPQKAFGVFLLRVYAFLHLRISPSMEQLTGK